MISSGAMMRRTTHPFNHCPPPPLLRAQPCLFLKATFTVMCTRKALARCYPTLKLEEGDMSVVTGLSSSPVPLVLSFELRCIILEGGVVETSHLSDVGLW